MGRAVTRRPGLGFVPLLALLGAALGAGEAPRLAATGQRAVLLAAERAAAAGDAHAAALLLQQAIEAPPEALLPDVDGVHAGLAAVAAERLAFAAPAVAAAWHQQHDALAAAALAGATGPLACARIAARWPLAPAAAQALARAADGWAEAGAWPLAHDAAAGALARDGRQAAPRLLARAAEAAWHTGDRAALAALAGPLAGRRVAWDGADIAGSELLASLAADPPPPSPDPVYAIAAEGGRLVVECRIGAGPPLWRTALAAERPGDPAWAAVLAAAAAAPPPRRSATGLVAAVGTLAIALDPATGALRRVELAAPPAPPAAATVSARAAAASAPAEALAIGELWELPIGPVRRLSAGDGAAWAETADGRGWRIEVADGRPRATAPADPPAPVAAPDTAGPGCAIVEIRGRTVIIVRRADGAEAFRLTREEPARRRYLAVTPGAGGLLALARDRDGAGAALLIDAGLGAVVAESPLPFSLLDIPPVVCGDTVLVATPRGVSAVGPVAPAQRQPPLAALAAGAGWTALSTDAFGNALGVAWSAEALVVSVVQPGPPAAAGPVRVAVDAGGAAVEIALDWADGAARARPWPAEAIATPAALAWTLRVPFAELPGAGAAPAGIRLGLVPPGPVDAARLVRVLPPWPSGAAAIRPEDPAISPIRGSAR